MDDLYKIIVNNAKEAIIIIDEGVITYVNQYTADVLGYEIEDFIKQSFLEFVADDFKKKVAEGHRKTMSGESTFIYEAEFKKKDGSTLPGEIHAQRITHKGKVVELALIRDITARKKAERIFHLQEERFHGVTENTPDIIARFDREYRYVYINAAGEKVFGVPKKDFFWKTDKDLGIEDERTEAFRDAIDYVFKNKKKRDFYSTSLVNGERRYYYTILVPEFFKDGEINSALSITRDITELREIDQIKSEFISITSHQLRSPLSVINWCVLSLLRGDADESEEDEKEYLHKIQESTRKLIKITDVFLNTTMLDLEMFTFNARKMDVIQLAEEIIREVTRDIEEKKIEFNTNFGHMPLFKVDPRVIKIIFRGLLSNAIDYTPELGVIDFSLKKSEDGEIILKVGDSGCGIAKEDQTRVFNKFYRAEAARNVRAYGTGLDLYLIKSILREVGGDIKIESPNPKHQKGSVFHVRIPTFDGEPLNS